MSDLYPKGEPVFTHHWTNIGMCVQSGRKRRGDSVSDRAIRGEPVAPKSSRGIVPAITPAAATTDTVAVRSRLVRRRLFSVPVSSEGSFRGALVRDPLVRVRQQSRDGTYAGPPAARSRPISPGPGSSAGPLRPPRATGPPGASVSCRLGSSRWLASPRAPGADEQAALTPEALHKCLGALEGARTGGTLIVTWIDAVHRGTSNFVIWLQGSDSLARG